MFKKRNLVSKLWLKYTDKAAYKDYKWELINYTQAEFTNFLTGDKKINSISKIKAVTDAAHTLNLSHSGNAGDIIYALPTIKKIYEITGAAINLYLRLGKLANLRNYNTHPLGNVMLNQKMADMLSPLIRSQEYINKCEIYSGQVINIDLDYFRAGTIPTQGNIARWCSYITGVSPDLWRKWLTVKPDTKFADSIVIARSGRYQNRDIDYSFMNKYKDVIFIGIENEYKDIQRFLPGIRWIELYNFLEMAQIIAGCKFFIGNQSFPYSVAEALKVPRILEVSFEIINVNPEGENGYDFFFQQHLESLVAQLNGEGL
jgi:hypothetical protein